MPRVLTKCPETDTVVSTVLRLQPTAFANLSGGRAFRCAACGGIHQWEKDAAWLEETAA